MDEIRRKFQAPPQNYGPTPFWAINESMNKGALRASLEDLKKKGFAGVIIHPRSGLEVEYLSPRFWEGMDFIIQSLVELSLKGWIYDEYNWPSGVCGGKLLREHPEFRQKGLNHRVVRGRASVPLRGPLVAAFDMGAMKPLPGQDGLSTFIPPPGVKKSLVFFIEPMTDATFATTCAPWAGEETGALDYLNPEAVAAFMEMTHCEYERRYSEHFGKTLLGVFTDEPQNHRGLMWRHDFAEQFKERAGYDLLEVMHRLALDSPEAPRTRVDFYRVASELYRERYFDVVAGWCEERGLIFTGHLCQEDFPKLLPANHGSLLLPLGAMQMPGIDWLGSGHGFDKSPTLAEAPNLGPKMVSSIAHLMERERSLVELWGGGGWAFPPAKMKRSLDWVFGCGVNFINPHQVWVSSKGLRKRDFPQSFSKPQPWWNRFARFSEYIARLSYLLSRGTHRARSLLLFPTVTMWAKHRGRGEGPRDFVQTVEALNNATDFLLTRQLDFDYLFEEALERYEIKDGYIRAGAGRFDAVVIPAAVEPVEATTAWLKKAERAKIKIIKLSGDEIADNLPPSDIGVEGALARNIIAHHRVIKGNHIFFMANLSDESGGVEIRLKNMAGKKLELWNTDDGAIYSYEDYKTDGGDINVNYFFEGGTSIVLACGDDDGATPAERVLPLQAYPLPRRLDSQTTEKVVDFDDEWEFSLSDKNLFLIEPWELETRRKPVRSLSQLRKDRRYGVRARMAALAARGGAKVANLLFKPRRNYRFLRFFAFNKAESIKPLAEKLTGIYYGRLGLYEGMVLTNDLFTDYVPLDGWPGLPGAMPGEEYVLRTRIRSGHPPEDLELVYEDLGEPVSIEINGMKAPSPRKLFVWDDCNRAVAVASMFKDGWNDIVFKSRLPAYPSLFPAVHAPEIIILRGTFRNGLTKKDPAISAQPPVVRPGSSWTRQGLKNYLGDVIYGNTFTLNDDFRRLSLDLGEVREAAEVVVNGERAGLRLWPPYRFDITDYVVKGLNTVEISVCATAANLFERPHDSGLLSLPRLLVEER